MRGDGGEGDRLACFDQLGAGRLDPCEQIVAHAEWTRNEPVEAFDQPAVAGGFFAPAAGLRVGHQRLASTRWVSSVGKNVASVRKFGQCSQMFA